MEHAFRLLDSNGIWFLTNKGEEEQKRQRKSTADFFFVLRSWFAVFKPMRTTLIFRRCSAAPIDDNI
ncbi:hypothetical protein [Aneurinibacillus terranovensis]|uniref:hypothetical protein n=1 Tax=Aneurinibacillus terranovensis TaxID=278991 RepID=UPI0012DCE33B